MCGSQSRANLLLRGAARAEVVDLDPDLSKAISGVTALGGGNDVSALGGLFAVLADRNTQWKADKDCAHTQER